MEKIQYIPLNNGSINFNYENASVKIMTPDKRIGWTSKEYKYEREDDEGFQYFQEIGEMLNLLREYKYPVNIKFKNLEDEKSEIIFMYEGQEVSIERIKELYYNLKEEKKLKKDVYYKGEYNEEEENLVNGCKINSFKEDKNNEKVYNAMVKQYQELLESLPPEEREKFENSLLVYNSCLYEAINQLVAVPDYRNKTPKELWEQLKQNPQFMKTTRIFMNSIKVGIISLVNGYKGYDEEIYSRLSIVNIKNVDEYIKSLISVYDTIMKYKEKLELQEDVYLYRGIEQSSEDREEQMARSEIVSTSLDRKVARKYFRESKQPTFYMIKVKKGTKFMVIPYQLLSEIVSYEKGKEAVKYKGIDSNNSLENKEVLLFGDEIEPEVTSASIINEGSRKIKVIEAEVRDREKEVEDGKVTTKDIAEAGIKEKITSGEIKQIKDDTIRIKNPRLEELYNKLLE